MDNDVTALAVPVVDTDGRQLRLCVTPTTHVAVASRDLRIQGAVVSLEVLAASHRVRIVGDGDWSLNETVACDLESYLTADRLPEERSWSTLNHTMRFHSALLAGSTAVEAAAAELASLPVEKSLVVRFPGHLQALTAIQLLPSAESIDSIAWRTWHLYPGSDPHVVTTSTVATAKPPSAEPLSAEEGTPTALQGSGVS